EPGESVDTQLILTNTPVPETPEAQVPDGVRVIDADYTVIMANESYARQAGGSRAELVGVPCYAIHGRTERCPPTLVTCPFHAIKADGEPIKYIHCHVRSDGSEVHVETTAARLTISEGGTSRVLIIEAIRDLEQQVRYSQEQRLAEIGQLAAGVAHEIYNPLASIRLGLQAVLRRARSSAQLDTETTHFLDMVDGEVDKCIGVTKRLLDLSQVPSQSLQLVSFSTITPEVLSLLRYEAEHSGVEVRIDMGGHDLRVLATDSELRMLVLHLSQNAFHAMPKGGSLTITGRVRGDRIEIEFGDSGVGIDDETLPHIFDPFFSKRADGIHGTGLGLTICKAIAVRYGGSIAAVSRLGAGTTFTVDFPRPDGSESLA
ncbi:MAG: ATP-binding protein, partial [Hyphomicrobium sp.]